MEMMTKNVNFESYTQEIASREGQEEEYELSKNNVLLYDKHLLEKWV